MNEIELLNFIWDGLILAHYLSFGLSSFAIGWGLGDIFWKE